MDYSPLVLEHIYEWQQCFIQLIVEEYEITESEYDRVSFHDIMHAFQTKTHNHFDISMFNDHLNELGITLKKIKGVNYLVGLRPKRINVNFHSNQPYDEQTKVRNYMNYKRDYCRWIGSILSICGIAFVYTNVHYNEH